MAKVSTNPIENYEQDWGNDPKNNLPFSGKEVQKFIKNELQNKLGSEDAATKIKEELKSQLFGGGTNGIVTDVDGTSESLTITSRDYEGNSTTKSINIGTPDENDRIVTVFTQLSSQYINVGGSVKLSIGYTVADYQGELIPNSFATVSVAVSKQGSSNAFYKVSLGSLESATNNSSLNHELDLTSAITNNITGSSSVIITTTVNYTYEYTDEEGNIKRKTITKYNSTTLTVLSLTLTTAINIAKINNTGQVSIPYTVRGNGEKSVYLYKNGKLIDTHSSITNASHSGTFLQDLSISTDNFQIVAETTAGNTTVRSSSFYFDLVTSANNTVIAFLVEDIKGNIQNEASYLEPRFSVSKFSDFKFNYFTYNSELSTVSVNVITEELDSDNKVIVSNLSNQELGRKVYTYSKKIKSSNTLKITFKADTVSRIIYLNPLASSINIELPTANLQLNLDADGRSNEELNPAVWEYGEFSTKFKGLNWETNGWKDNSLLLQNGAKAIINFPLFQSINGYAVTKEGCTFEVLFKCSNAALDEQDIISCYWNNNEGVKTGLNITTTYVGVNTGETTEYKDDNGEVTQSVVTRVGAQYAQDNWYKYTFVIDPNAPGVGNNKGLCYGYLNGILSYIAAVPSSFINLDKLPIIIDSTYADVYVKSIKFYKVPLTHDQVTDAYIVDQSDATEIEELYNSNNVLSSDKDSISPQKLRAKGHGVMIVTPSKAQTTRTLLQDLNKSDNKKTYYGPFRVDYYAPTSDLNLGYSTIPSKGNLFNFTHTECAIRIQGTTSTKRPRKNYRINFNKKDTNNKPASGSFIVGGEIKDSFKYAMSQGAVEVPIICLKTDYVDSSMTHNTGGAVIYNEITKNVPELRNAAQKLEFVNSPNDIKTRAAIEGFPVDVFAASSLSSSTDEGEYRETLEDSRYSDLEYMGQYNFNNDKSKSGKVFGFDGAYMYNSDGIHTGTEDDKYQPICIEFLDNSADLDLFKTKFTERGTIDEAKTYENFANSLEVRAPADVTDQVADNGLDSLKTTEEFSAYSYVPDQIKRVFNFIGLCAEEVATNSKNNKSKQWLNTATSDELEALDWSSNKFLKEAKDYLDLFNVCAWYIWTDYLIAVDQRAKNMMFYTMDGKHWGFQYYDGDTVLGERNDCFLAYDYLTDRTTWDSGVKQYAMQGHDSWLWYLIRANFSVQRIIDGQPDPITTINLSKVCQEMRNSGKFSAEYLKQILNGQFVNNWSERQYNYSQDYKYIQPLTETGYPSSIGTNYISTAQGSRESHRTYTIDNRFSLLDSKYQAGGYSQDSFIYYAAEGSTNILTIVSSIPYYFGWNTSNTSIREHQEASAKNNYTIKLTITGNSANNPANVLGASKIKELTFDPSSAWTVDASKVVKLPTLQKLVAKDMGNRAVGALYLSNCYLLNYVDLSGSDFTGLYGLENSSKMTYLNIENTNITTLKVADNAPYKTIKLATAKGIYLSNLSELKYSNSDTDTLTAQDWSSLDHLYINNCPNINWEMLVVKLLSSSVKTKYLRITGINEENTIDWLDQFKEDSNGNKIYGIDENGNETTVGAQLVGVLQLTEYIEDEVLESYKEIFQSLTIKQPEYTMIVTDETVLDETGFTYDKCGNVTNLDNNTGYGTPNKYSSSGHIKKILNSCHRYLGKVVTPGKEVDLPGHPSDTTTLGKSFKGRDMSGTMLVCQLSDKDSTYFNTGYKLSSTRREAPLDGAIGNGGTYVKIPKFWYKGINYNPIKKLTISKKYTCYSSNDEKPSVSSEVKLIKIKDLKKVSLIEVEGTDDGLYREKAALKYTNNVDTVNTRLSSSNKCDIFRINVKGYKKIYFPITIGSGCAVFTDQEGNVLSNEGGLDTNAELFATNNTFLYNGMPTVATIPNTAHYFYFTLCRYVNDNSPITSDPCNIVLHKGSKYSSGDEMTDANAREWIADMEPEWVQSYPVCIGAAECQRSPLNSNRLMTSFDGTMPPSVGNGSSNSLDNLTNLFQYSFRRLANTIGLQLIDFEASNLLSNLFIAKYGRRNSQNQLGAGTASASRKGGMTRTYGMVDTVVPPKSTLSSEGTWQGAAIPVESLEGTTYVNVTSPCFLGIENIHGNVYEWLERAYTFGENSENTSKITITQPDLSIRKVYTTSLNGKYPIAMVHGKRCDMIGCGSTFGTSSTGYSDSQTFVNNGYTAMSDSRAIARSGHASYASGGVFYLGGSYSVGYSGADFGSRLLFRGNIVETTDIDKYLAQEEFSG